MVLSSDCWGGALLSIHKFIVGGQVNETSPDQYAAEMPVSSMLLHPEGTLSSMESQSQAASFIQNSRFCCEHFIE